MNKELRIISYLCAMKYTLYIFIYFVATLLCVKAEAQNLHKKSEQTPL